MLLFGWDCVEPFWSCIDTAIWTFNPLGPTEVHYMNNPGMFSSKTLISFQLKKERMNILDDMGVSKLPGNFYSGS